MSRITAPFGRRSASVSAREEHGAYVVLRCEDPAGPRPQAGQFYMLASEMRWGGGTGERPYLPRAFSVLRAPPDSAELQFLIEDVGPGTNRLCELDQGDALLLVGPLGTGFTAPREGRAALLVGGGVGIAPLAILQDQLDAVSATLLGFRDRAHAPGADLLGAPRVATEDGTVGYQGLVSDLLREQLELGAHLEVFACGPHGMLETVRLLCDEHSTPAQLAMESGMACGFGACFGCVVPTTRGHLRLCVEGPVLDAQLLQAPMVAAAP